MPKIIKVLAGCVSAETAFVQPDYPYGRLRCQRRVWLEYKPREGFRTVYQTSNPKRNNDWGNKPKASTYSMLEVLTLTDEHMYQGQCTDVQGWVGFNGNLERFTAWMAFFGKDLDANQKAVADRIAAMYRANIAAGRAKFTGIKFRVTDAETGEEFSPETTACDPMFAAGLVPQQHDYASDLYKNVLAKHGINTSSYNYATEIGRDHPVGIFDSYVLGRIIRLDYLSGGQ